MSAIKYHHEKFNDQIDHVLGFEPALKTRVWVASVNHKDKTVRPCHGYHIPNKQGYRTRKLAIKLGYKYVA